MADTLQNTIRFGIKRLLATKKWLQNCPLSALPKGAGIQGHPLCFMKNSMLAELLLALTDQEREEFRLFVRSPYFNRGKEAPELVALADTLTDLIARKPEEDEWSRDRVFEASFPDQPLSAKKLDNRMSLLLRLLRQFLSVHSQAGDTESLDYQLALARQYLDRGLPKRFERVIREAEERLESFPAHDYNYFQYMARKAELQHTHEALYLYRHTDLHLKRALEYTWLYYQSRRLEWQSALSTYQRMVKVRQAPGFLPSDNEPPLPPEIKERYPILHLQEAMCEALKKNAPAASEIEYFQSYLSRHKSGISFEYRQYFAALLRNLCIRHNNEQESDLLRTVHRLHMEHLGEGYLFYTPGQLQARTFLNIVTVALMVGEDACAGQFMEQYRYSIVGDTGTQDYYRLACAQLLAFREQWEAALEILPDHFPRVEEGLVRIRLEIVLLFETRSPLLPARLDAFKVYLNRLEKKALSPTMKKRQTSFLNLVYQLLRARPGDLRRSQKIRDRILAIPNLPNKTWLLRRANDLTRQAEVKKGSDKHPNY